MKCENWLKTEPELEEWVKQHEKVVLYGVKPLGVILLRYYQKKGLTDRILGLSFELTKSEHQTFLEKTVKPIEQYSERKGVALLILGRNEQQSFRLKEQAAWEEEQTACLEYHLAAKLSQRDHIDLDFLCVGFTKCGTTSLYQALRKNKNIFMPKEKEILYWKWKNQYLDAPERFQSRNFPEECMEKVKGCIEPTYFQRANFVYESFGTGTKLIFMMRNPADATYSYFKMMMRRSYEPKQREYFHKYGKYTPEMFQDYMDDYIFSRKEQRFCYDIWLKEYLQFYKKEDIMVILFEEIIKEPERILKEVQEFIGVKPKKMKELPHSNPGKQVARNYLSARINGKLHELAVNTKKSANPKQKKRVLKLRLFIQKFTLVDNSEKISAVDKDKLMSFYQPSIKEVEQLLGRSLKGIWYH